MKVKGNTIRRRLDVLELQLSTLQMRFRDAQSKFEGEEKQKPQVIDEEMAHVEASIAALQEAQAILNLQVKPTVAGKTYTMVALIKLLGAAGRREKAWRDLAMAKHHGSYPYNEFAHERDPSKQYAQPQVTAEQAATLAMKAADDAAQIREAIAWGNVQEVEIMLDPKVLGAT